MFKLDELLSQVLEQGADAEMFSVLLEKIASVDPADSLLLYLKALSINPDLILVRLELSKLLWRLDCAPFALEELQKLQKICKDKDSPALKKLIEKMGGSGQLVEKMQTEPAKSETLASVDLDMDSLEGK